MALNLGSIISTLKAAGLTGSTLTTAVSTLASNSPTAALQGYCTQMLANSANPTVIKDLAVKMSEVPNLPNGITPLIAAAANAPDPSSLVVAVKNIEDFLTASNPGFGGFHLGF